MKIREQWCTWAILLASFALMVQAPARAQDQNQNQGQSQSQSQDQTQSPDPSQVQNQNPDQSQNQPQPQNPDQAQNQDQRQNQDQPQNQDQAQSQPQNPAPGDQDPPGRVARLNYFEGSVSFQPGGENDWVTAVVNRPMVTGDNLWADENSRAEAHIGSTAIRLGPKTGITFLEINDQTTQIRLAEGSLIVRVRHVDDDDTYEVDTPNLVFALVQPGDYRIDVNADGSQTVTTVWHGRGEVTGGGSSYTVIAGQSATFTGTNPLTYDIAQIPRTDSFEQWAFDRDDREDHADSANYVSREMTGYEDLDESGDWSYVAGYGPCWRPRTVAVGWAPYRFGNWTFVAPWGWTWVEDEPWGFAPFHYGRWAFVNSGWFWVPGPVVVRPIWAPALVAFVGGGPGFRFSASIGGGVGWFPLGPGEVFVPGYRVSRNYVTNVNITNTRVNVTNITNVYNTVIVNHNVNRASYVNQRVNGGVTVVSRDTFVNARPVARNVVSVLQREIETAPVGRGAQVEPVRASVLGAGRPASVRPPAAVMNRQVVAQRPPAAAPRPFEQRQAQAGGRLNESMQQQRNEPAMRPGQSNGNARPQQSDDGFRPFTPPNRGNAQPPQGSRPNPNPADTRNQGPDNRYQRPMQPSGGFRPPQQTDARPAPQDWSHPLARPAPPVQEKTPQREQQDESKFRNWQQSRPAPAPRQEQRAPEQKQEKPKH
jgi:hypothetical protein